MKTVIIFSTLFTLASMGAIAQTTKEKLEKVKADPKTKERAAKADVYIAKQSTQIVDTTTVKTAATKPISTSSTNNKRKKKQGN